MKHIHKLAAGETWKARAVDLSSRFDMAQEYITRQKRIIFDALTGGAKFLCRTDRKYTGDLGSMWYQTSDGSVVAIDHEARDISVYASLDDARALYATFGAPHNVAAYQKLMEVR
jgi:glutathione synthase/RimK-type ligase-like ATP-grasp enzyme